MQHILTLLEFHCIILYIGNKEKQSVVATDIKEVVHMIENILLQLIFLLLAALVAVFIIAFALMIVLVHKLSK